MNIVYKIKDAENIHVNLIEGKDKYLLCQFVGKYQKTGYVDKDEWDNAEDKQIFFDKMVLWKGQA